MDENPLGKWQQLQHCKSIIPHKFFQEMRNNVGLTFSVSELYRDLQLVLSKTIRIGDTKYHTVGY